MLPFYIYWLCIEVAYSESSFSLYLLFFRFNGSLDKLDGNAIVMYALIARGLCYFNSAVNPVIYNFMSGECQTKTTFFDYFKCNLCLAFLYIYIIQRIDNGIVQRT